MSDLADLISAKAEGMSNRQIAEKAGVRAGTVDRIMNGVGTPKVETLDKIAHALAIPVQEIREAAGRPPGQRSVYTAPPESRLLDSRQRRALDELVRSFVTGGVSDGVEDATQQDAPSEAGQGEKTSLDHSEDWRADEAARRAAARRVGEAPQQQDEVR